MAVHCFPTLHDSEFLEVRSISCSETSRLLFIQQAGTFLSKHDYSFGSLVENGLASVRRSLAGVLELDPIPQFLWNRTSLQVTVVEPHSWVKPAAY
ncbi:unnamed protein product [Ixodes persulcatus]